MCSNFGFCLCLLSIPCAFVAAADQEQPLTPKESLARIQLNPGLKVELVAAEPEVFDPVAMAFDELGRMYVVEDRGYPSGPGEGQPPAGSVALLEDKDGDGRYETRHLFAEGLEFPNGVMCWRGGVLVTDAPYVYFFKDTDGDHRADVKEVLLEGFSLGGSTQLRVSHPTLSMDNWIYFTNGLSGGEVGVAGHPEVARVDLGNLDLRYHPLTHALEAVAGQAQFGLSFNDLNDKFVCSNRKHVEHVVFQPQDLAKNPHLQFSQTVADIPDHGGAARIYAISEARTTAYAHAGTFTAACGLLVYRGTALPEEYYGNSFTCDPTGNLVHRDVLEPSGPTYVAKRVEQEREFFASSDNWTRPVFLANGPDGALYVCDMYRKTIEHPTYLPKEVAEVTDFDAGKQHGRIYRVSGVGAPPTQNTELPAEKENVPAEAAGENSPPHPSPLPLKAGGEGTGPGDDVTSIVFAPDPSLLIPLLGHPDAWTRETAHRLILEQAPSSELAPALRAALNQGNEQAKLHALYLLEAQGALSSDDLGQALKTTSAAVREHGLRLLRLAPAEHEALVPAISALAKDDSARVRFQVALALADVEEVPRAEALAAILTRDVASPWMRAAVFGSNLSVEELVPFMGLTIEGLQTPGEGVAEFMDSLGRLVAIRESKSTTMHLLALPTPAPLALFAGALEGIAAGDRFPGDAPPLVRLQTEANHAPYIQALVEKARAAAPEGGEQLSDRLYAIRILAQGAYQDAGALLVALLAPQHPPEIQLAAVQALGKMDEPAVAEALTRGEAWGAFSTGVRSAALGVLLARPERTARLLEAIEAGDVPAWSVDPASRARLEGLADAALKERAAAAFADVKRPDRTAIYQEYRPVLDMTPDPKLGREVFLKNCSTCHTYNGEGHQVGPDLTGLSTQPLESILLHILDPNWLMEPGYENYLVETSDFESYSGLITAQSPSSITIKQSMGTEATIPRENIERISATSLSMMPEELEKAMTKQELRNLLGFLKGE